MRRMITLLLALVMVFSLAACSSNTDKDAAGGAPESSVPEERLQLRVGMECDYAPSNWQEDTATDTNVPIENLPGFYAEGYDVQIARILADQLDRELVIVKLSWDGLIEALNQGQIDAIIAGMADTEERRESINFSDAYHITEYGVMVNGDSPYADAKSIHDFSGASVLGQKSTKLDEVIDQMDGVNHLNPVSDVPSMITCLQQGTCDAIVVNLESTDLYLEANPNFKVISFEEGNGFALGFSGSCVGLRKSDTGLQADINAVLATIDQATRDEMWTAAVNGQPD